MILLNLSQVCLLQIDRKWEKRPVPDGSESEYMFKDREWITYETIDNIRKRAAYVVANNLGGMFVWSRMFFSEFSMKLFDYLFI
jgi:tRNA nucleotidyltransferase (CCA-adding enzyme)